MVLSGIRSVPACMWSQPKCPCYQPHPAPKALRSVLRVWGANPPGALTQPEAGACFLLETLNCHKRLWLGRLSHLQQRQGREGAPLLCPLQPHPEPPPSPAANCWPSPDVDKEAKQEKQGRAPSHSPHPKGLRHSHGYREAGEAIDLPKAMERAQRPFKFPGPSSYIHHSNKPKKSNPERSDCGFCSGSCANAGSTLTLNSLPHS